MIDSKEFIIHRIPPPLDQSTKDAGNGEFRPTSQRMQLLKPDDSGLSCSRVCVTSPHELLEQLRTQNKDPSGWGVCVLPVAKVIEMGLEVVHVPEPNDAGHCEIRGKFARKTPKKLAKISRMLTDEEIKSGKIKELS